MKSFYVAIVGVVMLIMSGCSSKDATASMAQQDVVIQKIDKDDIRDIMKQEKMIYDIEPPRLYLAPLARVSLR